VVGNPPSCGHRLEREGAGAQIAGGDAERSTLARAVIVFVGGRLGTQIYPRVETGQLQVRLRASAGTDIDGTEKVFLKALNLIKALFEADNLQISLD